MGALKKTGDLNLDISDPCLASNMSSTEPGTSMIRIIKSKASSEMSNLTATSRNRKESSFRSKRLYQDNTSRDRNCPILLPSPLSDPWHQLVSHNQHRHGGAANKQLPSAASRLFPLVKVAAPAGCFPHPETRVAARTPWHQPCMHCRASIGRCREQGRFPRGESLVTGDRVSSN
jgi:hypothetical protein